LNSVIFGDVHGDARALKALISKARALAGSDVALYSVGDLLDRGPGSKGVIDICVGEGVQGLLGNHELWMHKLLTTGEFDDFALHGIMGGEKTLTSYEVSPTGTSEDIADRLLEKIPDSHKEFFLSLPLHRKLVVGRDTYRLTHGGIPRLIGMHAETSVGAALTGILHTSEHVADGVVDLLAKTQPEVFLWGGAKKTNVYAFSDGSLQVFGHTPWRGGAEISEEGQYIALDTGCGTCPPYKLSGVLLSPEGGRKLL